MSDLDGFEHATRPENKDSSGQSTAKAPSQAMSHEPEVSDKPAPPTGPDFGKIEEWLQQPHQKESEPVAIPAADPEPLLQDVPIPQEEPSPMSADTFVQPDEQQPEVSMDAEPCDQQDSPASPEPCDTVMDSTPQEEVARDVG